MSKTVVVMTLNSLCAAWPKKELKDEEIHAWAKSIDFLAPEVAAATVQALVETSEWFPTIAKFLEMSRSVRRHRADSVEAHRTQISDEAKRWQDRGIDAQRLLSAERTHRLTNPQRGHDHREGWQACPVCVKAHEECTGTGCSACAVLVNVGIRAKHYSS